MQRAGSTGSRFRGLPSFVSGVSDMLVEELLSVCIVGGVSFGGLLSPVEIN